MNLKKLFFKIFKYLALILGGFILLLSLGVLGYFVIFNSVSNSPSDTEAIPNLSSYNLETWESQRQNLLNQFSVNIYGPYPDPTDTLIEIKRETLQDPLLDSIATIEQITYKTASGSVEALNLILILPKNAQKSVPVIIGQNFGGNPATFRFQGVNKSSIPHKTMGGEPGGADGLLMSLVKIIMGEHLVTPPLEKIIESGYGFAGFYPGELVPDNKNLAPAYLEKFKSLDNKSATGAISVWAWGFNRVTETLSLDPRIDANKIALFGHSRHAKAALVAGAYEAQANLVISHQSGTGGASLNKSGIGESIESITTNYPHWFDKTYSSYAQNPTNLPIDQHQLIALAAPTPVILGNGQHDKWSDPMTAFKALQGASPIYELYNLPTFTQTKLNKPNFQTPLTLHMRPGPHGTRVSDWEVFLRFMAVQF